MAANPRRRAAIETDAKLVSGCNTSQADLDAAPWGHLPIHGLNRRSYYLFYIIIINRDEANGFFSPPKEKVAYTDESHKENHL